MTVFIAMATVFVSMKSMFVPNEHGLHRDEDGRLKLDMCVPHI
ncbi:hypothetical protein PRABACTJOHN_01926 [Parabacteroides johnsonii DSM 18315]|jgi:hypothetical protein|uniref:Uncharacterized protein n=1 Tax=Parabacteroides johnsonii DSM 18315 TaxID=537006 RepID=B7BA71_9BACT|nr:hypothetical protein PRABACTJOHN_01926 [Parabacteroides johnsonii DSM 18315]